MARAISAAELAHGLKGAHFPMNTRQLIEHARHNNAPNGVVEAIKQMPGREFSSLAEVEHAFSQSHKGEEPKTGKAADAARKGGTQHRSKRCI